MSLTASDLPASATALFPRPQPLEVELGCGRGRFLLARARRYPQVNFLGVDRVLLRLRKLDLRALAAGVQNVRLVHGEAVETCQRLLPPETVSACYILFPDPWPKRRHHRRRLITPEFVTLMYRILRAGATLHLATDDAEYLRLAVRIFTDAGGWEPAAPLEPDEEEQTDFEIIFRRQQRPIYRCAFRKLAG